MVSLQNCLRLPARSRHHAMHQHSYNEATIPSHVAPRSIQRKQANFKDGVTRKLMQGVRDHNERRDAEPNGAERKDQRDERERRRREVKGRDERER